MDANELKIAAIKKSKGFLSDLKNFANEVEKYLDSDDEEISKKAIVVSASMASVFSSLESRVDFLWEEFNKELNDPMH